MFSLNENVGIKIKDVCIMTWDKSAVTVAPRGVHALVYREKGRASFECGGKMADTFRGDVFYMPANMEYKANYPEYNRVYVIHFESDFKGNMDNYSCTNGDAVGALFRKAADIWQGKDEGYYCDALCVFGEIVKHISAKGGTHAHKEYPPSFLKAVEYMENNFALPQVNVALLAYMAHVSTTYFRKLFQDKYLCSPSHYLSDLRFAYAEKLLSSGKYTVGEVAYMSGFNDVKYFSRKVKNKYGVPPSALYKFN